MLKDNFSTNLRYLRKEKRLTLEELAFDINKKLGTKINKSMLSKFENGATPSLTTIKELSIYFNMPINKLLGFNEENEKKEFIPVLRSLKSMGDKGNIITYSDKPPMLYTLYNDQMFYYQVKTDIMNEILPINSLALIKRTSVVEDNDIILILFNSGLEAFYRVISQDDLLYLLPQSSNRNHKPKMLNIKQDNFKIFGKVISVTVMI